ncbi:cysteine--tRNA ligase [Euzebya tangerina]|uniref:cysteine--tRNA ligase n=1 Tax=Euzebya tangerina TaxID=591198 RepID=UPI000E324558|nr:cysteine--tRNA ligase [Euzebya tangerina]
MRLYNTLTRDLDQVLTDAHRSGETPFSMYVCGPTVQDVPHFGHARAALIPDVFRRALEHQGIEVLHVRNITDVEDKIITRAEEEDRDPAAVSEQYSRVYEAQMKRLGILEPHIVPRATGHIIEMIELIELLLDSGHAYVVEGGADAIPGSDDVMFRVRSFEGYGKLSNRDVDQSLAGARVDADARKEDAADFVLWKAAKPGEPSWRSPWGPGRPGWHIECSAMARKYLGSDFDLHTGGTDLIFPHHENEIAQAEAAYGERFARLWLHNGMLNIDGEKMSKSLGNFITLDDAISRYGGPVVRLYFLQIHYRSIAQFSGERLREVESAWNRLTGFVSTAPEGGQARQEVMTAAVAALGDDLNTPEVVSAMFTQVKEGHAALADGRSADAGAARATVMELAGLLGLDLATGTHDDTDVAPLVETLLELRDAAREAKDYATSDTIRDALSAAGIVVEDSRDGARWRRS